MEFSTGISQVNTEFNNFDAVDRYNKYLKDNSKFVFDSTTPTDFESALQAAAKNYPVHDKHDPIGLGNFAGNVGNALSNSLNAVNNAKLEANRMQEDIAMGGNTDIHAAMIAAEKASLSMQMAIQVRNRMISAYTEITGMML
mgnify:CR=1 FL=1